jgi:hypothetical protein
MPAVVQDVNIRLNVVAGKAAAPPSVLPAGTTAAAAAAVPATAAAAAKGGGAAVGGAVSGAMAAAGLGGLATVGGAIAAGIHGVSVGAPVVFERFTRTLLDISAVIGRSVAPVLETFTQLLRLFGDVLLTVLPSQKEMNEIMKPARDIINELANVFRRLTPIIRPLIISILRLGEAMRLATGSALKVIDKLMEKLGLVGEDLMSSIGAAPQPARRMGIFEYGQEARLAALAGTDSLTEQKKTNDNLEKTQSWLERIYDALRTARWGAGGEDWSTAVNNALQGKQ